MKKIITIPLLLLILASSAFAVGMAIPPSKTFNATIGQNFSISISIINNDGQTSEYSVSFGGDLGHRASAYPQTMTINPPLAVIHRGNPAEDGIADVIISVNSTGITPGTYSLDISTSVASGNKGTFNIIEEVTRSIQIDYKYPPSFINRILNGIFSGIKGIVNWISRTIDKFYEQNKWLNELFFLMALTIVFYIGIRMNRIMRYIRQKKKRMIKEYEKIKQHGFSSWIKRKTRDRFKKKKSENTNEHEQETVP